MKVKATKQLIFQGKVVRAEAEFEAETDLAEKLKSRNLVEILEEADEKVDNDSEKVDETQVDPKEEAKAEYGKHTIAELTEMAKEMEVDLKGITAKDDIIEKLIEAEFN